jgi:hypothetical protein
MQPSQVGVEKLGHLRDNGGSNVLGKIKKNTLGKGYLKFVIILCFVIQNSCFMLPYVIL